MNPMSFADDVKMEAQLAEELRGQGYLVYGGH
jgi:hypothetical protein